MTDTTREYVERMMTSTLASLTIAAKGIAAGLDVPDDEHALVPKGEGNDANSYLRDLVLEERTPEDCSYTEFVFTIGGPRIALRHYDRHEPEDWFVLIGNSAGLDEPIAWQIDEFKTPEAYAACKLLMDYDFMDLREDVTPTWSEHPSF